MEKVFRDELIDKVATVVKVYCREDGIPLAGLIGKLRRQDFTNLDSGEWFILFDATGLASEEEVGIGVKLFYEFATQMWLDVTHANRQEVV